MDRDLVERARAGDRDAFAHLVHQVSDRLYAVAFRILRDTGLAEDALQNALVTAWRQIPHLRDADRFDAWIHRVLVNSCYVEARRTRQWNVRIRALPDHDGPSTPDDSRATRRPRRAGAGVPPAPDRPAIGVRPAPLRRAAAGGDRRDPRHPRRHGPLATPLRDPGAAHRPSRPGANPSSSKDAWHDRRQRLRPRRSRLVGDRTGRRARPGGRGRPARDRNDIPGAGSSDPVEVPPHVDDASRRRGRDSDRGAGRWRTDGPASRRERWRGRRLAADPVAVALAGALAVADGCAVHAAAIDGDVHVVHERDLDLVPSRLERTGPPQSRGRRPPGPPSRIRPATSCTTPY